jgi:transmembrane sensor
MKHAYYHLLLEKYLNNQLSADESEILFRWLASPAGEQYLAERLDQDFELMDHPMTFLSSPPLDSDNLFSRIQRAKTEEPARSIHPDQSKNPRSAPPSSGRRYYSLAIAASLSALLLVAYLGWLIVQNWNVVRHETAYGETTTVQLTDGTEVVMNGNSSLKYRTTNPREVWLDGEAFFSVAHTPDDQKFLVHTSDKLTVEVLGTSFNVLKRRETTQVVLNTGKVQLHIKNPEDPLVVMEPGELVEFDDASTTYTRKSVNPEVYSSWKTDKIIFDNTSLGEIVLLLQETHGLTVEVANPALLKQNFTGSIPNQNVELLLEGLSQLFDLKITRDKNRIRIQSID